MDPNGPLRGAVLLISESTDLDAALQGLLDNARESIEGRSALIWLADDPESHSAFFTAGMTAEESDEFLNAAQDQREFFDRLTQADGPLRIDDIQSHLNEHGLSDAVSPIPTGQAMTYLTSPIRHFGERLGAICVAKSPSEVSADDEETLAVFASLAALAIFAGRRHQVDQTQLPRSQMLQFLGIMDEQVDAIRRLLDALKGMVEAQGGQSGAAHLVGARRSPGGGEQNWDLTMRRRFTLGDLSIDDAARLVRVSGSPVELARIEYNLLAELAANAGTVLTHEQLLTAVWGSDSAADPSRLRIVIKDLRRKLGDDARNPRYIVTVPRVGYRMPHPDDTTSVANSDP
ncbi:winged helix-turn-helix domain-containing protein [Candidatus Poriferisodalis sp.]|uniref:winged helix-turn-helix domain-containing protein n=1 Tax=Candidatus Poriferisodalis sp. TaxID=3101277 RepID=UPI003C702DEB